VVWVIAHVDVCDTRAGVGEPHCVASRGELRIFVLEVPGEYGTGHLIVSGILVLWSAIRSRSERPADWISRGAVEKVLRQIWFGKQDCGLIDT